LIFCNYDESIEFSQMNPETLINIEEVSLKIHKMLAPKESRILIITCGKDPVIISKYNYSQHQLDYLYKFTVTKIESKDIVDTNGCGDAFLGGFISQYINGRNIQICVEAVLFTSKNIL
jgi:adenosine kinase